MDGNQTSRIQTGLRAMGKFGLGAHLKFERVVGEGSEGQTWACEDLQSRTKVAVKILRRKKSLPNRSRKFNPTRVSGEIIMQCALNHPNVAKILAVYMSPTHLGIAMELVEGGELYQYVKKYPIPESVLFPDRLLSSTSSSNEWKHLNGRSKPRGAMSFIANNSVRYTTCSYNFPKLPSMSDKFRKHIDEDRARYFFRQICNAVSYCHRHHIAHRDLKLTNVLVDTSHRPPLLKIIDFGLSKHWFQLDSSNEGSTTGKMRDFEKSLLSSNSNEEESRPPLLHARCQTRVGSPMYVAREIVSRDFCPDGYDGTAIDIWSMGVMLYYMLRGKFPFPDFSGKGSMEILRKLPSHVKTDLLKTDLNKSELSEDVKDLLLKMLRFDVNSRIDMDKIYEHPWFRHEVSSERLDEVFADLYEDVSSRSFSRKNDISGFFSKLGDIFQGKRKKWNSDSTVLGDSMDGRDKNTERDVPTASSEPTSAVKLLHEKPSGGQFPVSHWESVKAIVERASDTEGYPDDLIQIWTPPFGPYRLTFTMKNGQSTDSDLRDSTE